MGVAKTDRFGVLRLGRRTVLRMMVLTVAGLMSLGAVTPAHADEPQGSFWTQFTPSSDTRLIFVSSSEGHDANSGLTPAQPVATIAKGKELLRDGFPDWMLLKRGDVWETGLGFWSKGGRAVDERMVVGAYGSGAERPQLRPLVTARALLSQGNVETRYLAFVGLHFEPRDRQSDDRPGGVSWLRRGGDVLFEDLYIAGFHTNVVLQSLNEFEPVDNLRINGCVIVDSWNKHGHSQGLYAEKISGLVIENSVFASNGFNHAQGAQPTIFNHNIYVQHGTRDVVVRGNIIADASAHGIQLRPGGILENNLFVYNPLSVLISNDTGTQTGDIQSSVRNNVVMYGRDISPTSPRRFGIEVSSIRSVVVSGNILFSSADGQNGFPLLLQDNERRGMEDIAIEENMIVAWNGLVLLRGPSSGNVFDNIRLSRNTIYRDFSQSMKPLVEVFSASNPAISLSENHYKVMGDSGQPFRIGSVPAAFLLWAAQVDSGSEYSTIAEMPSLDLDAYMSSVGMQGGMEEFLRAVRARSRNQFPAQLTPQEVYSWMSERLGGSQG